MNRRRMSMVMVLALSLLIATPATAETKAQKQAKVRQQAAQTLAKLYQAQPSAKATIKAALDMPRSAISA